MPCCSLFFGTETSQANCLLTAPITRNSGAFIYFPYATPPTAGKTKSVYVRLYSHTPIDNIAINIYVGAPLVGGVFSVDPTFLCTFTLGGSWVVQGTRIYKTGVFAFTPTQSQVTNKVCIVAKTSVPATAGCSCPTGFTNITLNPLAAVFDRPW